MTEFAERFINLPTHAQTQIACEAIREMVAPTPKRGVRLAPGLIPEKDLKKGANQKRLSLLMREATGTEVDPQDRWNALFRKAFASDDRHTYNALFRSNAVCRTPGNLCTKCNACVNDRMGQVGI
jgi:hypothetical protein